MAQPVKKKIQEIHPDLMTEKPFRTLLIDGTSLLMMCFKDDTRNSDGVHYGGVYQFLSQLRKQFEKVDPAYCYVFFDDTGRILHRQKISGKIDDSAFQCRMFLIKRCFDSHM
jgi:5'-3' exonuclease